jgi:hypothetical protein
MPANGSEVVVLLEHAADENNNPSPTITQSICTFPFRYTIRGKIVKVSLYFITTLGLSLIPSRLELKFSDCQEQLQREQGFERNEQSKLHTGSCPR